MFNFPNTRNLIDRDLIGSQTTRFTSPKKLTFKGKSLLNLNPVSKNFASPKQAEFKLPEVMKPIKRQSFTRETNCTSTDEDPKYLFQKMVKIREERIKKCNNFIQNQINKKFVCIKESEFVERQIKRNFEIILESNLASPRKPV